MKLLLTILSFLYAGLDHDIHVSVCEMVYMEEDSKIEMSIKIFYDDLLNAVGLNPGEELPEDYTSSDELITAFIHKNVKIRINGEVKDLNYEASHSYPPAVWSTFIIHQDSPIEQISMKNTILVDLFDDQVNMVTIKVGKKRKAYSLDGKNSLLDYQK